MINLGNMNIADLRLGASQVKALYLGSEQVWGGEEPTPPGPTPTDGPLCFTAEQANSTVHLDKNGSPVAISLETSTDGSTWTDYSWTNKTGDTLTLANVGDKVYMRAKTENSKISTALNNYYQFVMTGLIAASGNIQTLLKADGSRTDVSAYCYNYIFKDCTSLTTAPSLPATTLGEYCYLDMFSGCTSLTTAPAELPATTLAERCYQTMFSNCTSLAQAPAISATTFASSSCKYMFDNCASLSAISVVFTNWTNAWDNRANWVRGVAASGTFTCPAALPDERGNNKIPTGWTKASPAPDIFYNEAPTRVWYNDGTSAEYNIVGQATTSNVLSASQIEKIEFGNTVLSIGQRLFYNQPNLQYVYTGWNCEYIGTRAFNDSMSISTVVIGPGMKDIGKPTDTQYYAFSGAGPTTNFIFHDNSQLSSIGYGALRDVISCDELVIKSRASQLQLANWAISTSSSKKVKVFVFDVDVIPTCTTGATGTFAGQGFVNGESGCYVVVPDNLVTAWKATSPWSNWASSIISMTEYEAIKANT